LEPGEIATFLFLRGRCEEGVGGAITIKAKKEVIFSLTELKEKSRV
jgi:hypothetical protein